MHMQVIHGADFPPASRIPNGCSRCLAARRPMDGEPDGKEPIIDMGIDIDMEGAVYFCLSCFNELQAVVAKEYPDKRVEMAHAARRRDGSLMKALRDEAAALMQQIEAQRDQIEAMRGEVNALRRK